MNPTPSADPQPPAHGYEVPPGFRAPATPPLIAPEHDPLVPPPFGGFSPWWQRLVATLQRRRSRLAQIMLLTFALPQIGFAVLVEATAEGVVSISGGVPVPDGGTGAILTGGAVAIAVVGLVVISLMAGLGWGAGIWAVTQAAAGQPVTVGAALRVGARRMLPMLGWYLLYLLMTLAGLVLFVVPGIYLAVAGSLFATVVIFEPGRGGIGRSVGLVNRAFGAALGRVLLLFLFMLVAFCVLGGVTAVLGLNESAESAGARLTGNVIDALLSVLVYMVLLVGLLLTYAQLRARTEPLSTGQLWQAANQDADGGPPGYPAAPVGPV